MGIIAVSSLEVNDFKIEAYYNSIKYGDFHLPLGRKIEMLEMILRNWMPRYIDIVATFLQSVNNQARNLSLSASTAAKPIKHKQRNG